MFDDPLGSSPGIFVFFNTWYVMVAFLATKQGSWVGF